MDEDYLRDYYDPSIAVINTGRYTCISRDFFNWVRKALQLTRDEFTENTLDKDPKGGFEKAKQLVMGDRTLKQLFTARVKTSVADLPDDKLQESIDAVYVILLSKMFHARANVSFCRWKEKRVKMKDKYAFRFGLKANESSKTSKNQQSGAKKGKKQSSKAKKAHPKVVTDKKSGSNKGPVKVTPEQKELFDSNSSRQSNKKRKTNQTTLVDDPVSNKCDDVLMEGSEAGGEAGKELTMDTVQLM